MSDLRVITNGHHRDVLDAYVLTPAEREQFGYVDWPGVEDGTSGASFFRYRGELYDLGEFVRAEGELAEQGWDGVQTDSFFSATVIRYVDDWEGVVVARVHW